MPIKFFEQLKEKSRRKKEERGQEPKRKSKNEKKGRQKKSKGGKNERKGGNLFKRIKYDQMRLRDKEATYLNIAEDALFIENDKSNNNEYGSADPNVLTNNIALTGDGDANLNNAYVNSDPQQGFTMKDGEIKEVANNDKSPALVEHEVDAKKEELPEIQNNSPVAYNGRHKSLSMNPETQPEELGALSKNTPTSNPEPKQREPTPLSKATDNTIPSVNELSTNNIHAFGEVNAKSSGENSPKSKAPKEPGFSVVMPAPSSSLVEFKSSDHNEPLKASESSTSRNNGPIPQNIQASLTKTSNQHQMPEHKPIVGILKKASSPTEQSLDHVSSSAQIIKNPPQSTKPSDAKQPIVASSRFNVSSTKPKLDGVNDKPNRNSDERELWERGSNVKSYVHDSKATPGPCVSNAVSASRSGKNEGAAAFPMAASVVKAQSISKQSKNGKPKTKYDANSNSTSSDNSDVSSSSSTSSSSSSDSSDSSSWSTSDSSESESDSSSSSSSTSSDSDSDSDSDFDFTDSSSSSTNTSEIVGKNAKVITQRQCFSKPKEERF
ncbi:unnamed protein product [Hymenolepis diminuta]|uniref:Uncharacterized protein n=1 Tax=Hymenolepis diminuta TaxID=6216 RepID=A0A564Y473_HYMDI|nr:unnamed protein product [Hymenolepis diminuta]